MLSVDGYAPLSEFYDVAKRVVRWKLRDKITEHSDRRTDEPLLGEGMRLRDVYRDNIQIAAKYLVYDLFIFSSTVDGKSAALLRGDGSITNLEFEMFKPNEGVNRESSLFRDARVVEAKKFKRNEYIFGLQSLQSSYWYDAFMNNRVFGGGDSEGNLYHAARNPSQVLPLINWEIGNLALEKLKTLVEALTALKSVISTLNNINIYIGYHRLTELGRSDRDIDFPKGLLNMLEPYNGCPVVAPTKWLQTLYGLADASQGVTPSRDAGQPPRDRILDLWKEDPFLTKGDFKMRLFPEMSARGFDMHWKQAAEINPEIKKPGRRSAKS